MVKSSTTIIKLDAREPDKNRVRDIARLIRNGEFIIFPTETVYGIGSSAVTPEVSEKLNKIKGRPTNKPFSLHISNWTTLDTLEIKKTPLVRTFAQTFLPGPVTLIMPTKDDKKIGIRFPKNKIAQSIIEEVGSPFIATSANLSSGASPKTVDAAIKSLPSESFALAIDGGRADYALDSTVVDVAGDKPAVLREGALHSDVHKLIEKINTNGAPLKRILVVCTGNTCRSPIGEAWIRHCVEQKGLGNKIEVLSCGTMARDGLPCTPEAEFVMRNRGIDLSKFRSCSLKDGDLWSSDLIVSMTPTHTDFIVKRMPDVKDRIWTLDIEDPIGLGIDVYEKTLVQIEKKLTQNISRIIQID